MNQVAWACCVGTVKGEFLDWIMVGAVGEYVLGHWKEMTADKRVWVRGD